MSTVKKKKGFTLAHHNRRKNRNEPIRTQEYYMWPALSAGKSAQVTYLFLIG